MKKFFEIRLGKPQKTATAAKQFENMVRSCLYVASILWFVMQLPWIFYCLAPLIQGFVADSSDRDPLIQRFITGPDYSIQFILQLGIIATPVALAIGLIAWAIIFGSIQNDFLSIYAKEHSQTPSWQQKLLLWIPLARYWALYRFFGGLWPAVMIVSSLLFWLFVIFAGPLSPFPLILLALSIGVWIVLTRRLTGCGIKRSLLIWSKCLLGLFILSFLAGYATFYLAKVEIKAETLIWHSAGIPTSRAELEAHLFREAAPDPDFSALVDRRQSASYDSGIIFLDGPSGYYSYPASKRKQLKEYLAGEESKQDFNKLDELAASGSLLKYKINLEPNLQNTLLPHLNFHRIGMRYFSSRIIVALEEGNSTEAMRLFRLMTAFQESALQSDFLFGSLLAFACESIRSDTVGALLGSGLMTDTDLHELMELNRDRAKKFHSALCHGLRAESFMSVDTILDLSVPYPKIFLQIQTDNDDRYEKTLFHFLFRGNTTLFPTPPCLWTEAIQQRELLYGMRHQRAIIRYFDDPTDNYLRGVWRAALIRELETRPLYLEKLLLPDYQRIDWRFSRTLSMLRMSDLALKIELFRRANGHLPDDLSELGITLPVDALSGEPIRYAKGKIRLWDYDSNSSFYQFRELPGWQLSTPGLNWQLIIEGERAPEPRLGKGSITRLADDTEKHEARRDTFTVITQWPVPAPPEPPKVESSFDWIQSLAAPKEEEH